MCDRKQWLLHDYEMVDMCQEVVVVTRWNAENGAHTLKLWLVKVQVGKLVNRGQQVSNALTWNIDKRKSTEESSSGNALNVESRGKQKERSKSKSNGKSKSRDNRSKSRNMAGDLDGRRSTIGYIFTVGGTIVSWISRLQKVVALSTTEANKEMIWMSRFMEELGNDKSNCKLFSDSQSVIHLAKNSVFHSRTKHIQLRDWVSQDGQPNLSFFSQHFGKSLVQVADCDRKEFTDQKRMEMTVSEYIEYWHNLDGQMHDMKRDGSSLLYLKDWHFVKGHGLHCMRMSSGPIAGQQIFVGRKSGIFSHPPSHIFYMT
ncbi:hypothetical protein KI387_020773, partial [Taxus chinensis]